MMRVKLQIAFSVSGFLANKGPKRESLLRLIRTSKNCRDLLSSNSTVNWC